MTRFNNGVWNVIDQVEFNNFDSNFIYILKVYLTCINNLFRIQYTEITICSNISITRDGKIYGVRKVFTRPPQRKIYLYINFEFFKHKTRGLFTGNGFKSYLEVSSPNPSHCIIFFES